jgi:hypothetical protein
MMLMLIMRRLHDHGPSDPVKTNGSRISRYRWFLYVLIGGFFWYFFPGWIFQGKCLGKAGSCLWKLSTHQFLPTRSFVLHICVLDSITESSGQSDIWGVDRYSTSVEYSTSVSSCHVQVWE